MLALIICTPILKPSGYQIFDIAIDGSINIYKVSLWHWNFNSSAHIEDRVC